MERKVSKLIRNILFPVFVIGNLKDSLAYTKGSTERIITFPTETISGPKLDYGCGSTTQNTEDYAFTEITYDNIQGSSPHSETQSFEMYHQNATAERLLSEGFDVTIKNVTNDAISHFTASNGTFRITYEILFIESSGVAAGGGPAKRTRAYYMAQLGRRDGGKTSWLCDGVLINLEWILSAAHCFLLTPGSEPNIVRLGDYDLNEESKFYDYEMAEIIFHPKFNLNTRYHDLVLIRIPRKYPFYASTILPICLPWDSLSNKNLVGYNVTLTGWGATYYGGPKTSLLQQVYLQVFPTSTCDQSYKRLSDFRSRYPNGMTENTILCVGWNEDGKDACGGDSGAPIVYEPDPFTTVLAGIVSGGFGCGLSEYPGLYIPIQKPIYLNWIKDVAFKEVY